MVAGNAEIDAQGRVDAGADLLSIAHGRVFDACATLYASWAGAPIADGQVSRVRGLSSAVVHAASRAQPRLPMTVHALIVPLIIGREEYRSASVLSPGTRPP
ncbi:hypothetical protein FMUAM8_20660 [Nocardia cyriacigeorgica]|uniref:Uncharacterized protein n=1 Tax=Nocardia cyriacigeorgica (strain GUH-2) TaxID=1127134 RepID=H6RD53_NOCCG|nr:hypothetical protein FMUAM8_20660 [Nocardia cyriacigeorgica]CCF62697.1 protein of unknown function [Nocardia cyriacigeorgica GUH-2]